MLKVEIYGKWCVYICIYIYIYIYLYTCGDALSNSRSTAQREIPKAKLMSEVLFAIPDTSQGPKYIGKDHFVRSMYNCLCLCVFV